jgi:putative aldouronate transport system substrate-binding protein
MIIPRRTVLATAGGGLGALALTSCNIGKSSTTNDPTLHIAAGGAADNHDVDSDNPVAVALKEKIGVEIQHERSPEDISASLAAGDSPDIFRVTRNQLQTYADQGLVLDISERKDDLGDYIGFIGNDAVELGSVDGKITAIQKYQNNTNDTSFWIRQDWLDTLGIDAPTTADEFESVLTEFKKGDPDGAGAYGITGSAPDSIFTPLWGAFATPGPGRIYIGEDGEVRSSYDDDGLPEALEYIAKLQKAGLIDPDSYTLEGLEARDRGFQGKAGVMSQSWTAITKSGAQDDLKKANPDAEWVQLDLFKTPDGGKSAIPVSTDAATMLALPATLEGNDEKIKHVIDLINYVSTPEGNELVCYGIEGTHYEKDEKGDITPIKGTEDETNVFFVYQLTGREERPYLEAKFPDQYEYYDFTHGFDRTICWEEYVISPDGYNQSDGDRYAEDEMVKFLNGSTPVSEYEDFRNTMYEKFGYKELLAAAQDQLADLDAAE